AVSPCVLERRVVKPAQAGSAHVKIKSWRLRVGADCVAETRVVVGPGSSPVVLAGVLRSRRAGRTIRRRGPRSGARECEMAQLGRRIRAVGLQDIADSEIDPVTRSQVVI